MLVAFSCKTRGVCCSCGARRTAQTAANLVDRVLPDVPLRQWVLSAPFDLRIPMARDAALLTAVTRIFCSEIDRLLQRLGEERGVRHGASGQVASNLNPHQHVLGLDGVYSTSADGRVVFTATRAPAQSELLDVTQRVHTRVLRWLKRHGAGDEQDKADDDEPSPEVPQVRRPASDDRHAHGAGADSRHSRVHGPPVHTAGAGARQIPIVRRPATSSHIPALFTPPSRRSIAVRDG